MWKKIVVRLALRALGIDDEVLDGKCQCDVCNAIRKVLGLIKVV